jgi:serine/threonine-protein kinase
MLDRYELIAELASGGMAKVYLARLGGLAGFQRLFAIKHLHPYLHSDNQFVQMFLDEARLAAGIHHPNVVPILEVGATDAGYYLVMEYVEGDTLASLLARASSVSHPAVPFGISIRIMLDTLEGLEAAHGLTDDYGKRLGLVHRDVSPQNILVGLDGTARITDFGVARAASRLHATKVGQLKGKLAYMAPEQARGGQVDARTDVFAAGIVLWEALTMRRLFRGDNEAATLNRVFFEPIPRTRAVNEAIPTGVDAVVAAALEREPDARFPSCAAFAGALEAAAVKAGCSASAQEVASFVQATLGQEVQAQRDRVRAWLSRSEPSQAWPVVGAGPATEPGPHGVPVVVPPGEPGAPAKVDPVMLATIRLASRPRSRVGPIIVAVVSAVLAGTIVGLLIYVLSKRDEPVTQAGDASLPSATALPLTPSSVPAVPSPPTGVVEVPDPSDAGGPELSSSAPKKAPPAPGPRRLPSEKDDMSTNPYR